MIGALTLLWIVLTETLDPAFVVGGVITSVFAFFYSRKYLPLEKIQGVNFVKLATYPLFLVGQVYIGGLKLIPIIFKGERVDVVTGDTKLTNESLIAILGDSITITPGSIMLNVSGAEVTSLWIREKTAKDLDQLPNAAQECWGGLESQLIKAEKR